MKLIISKNKKEAAFIAAQMIADEIKNKVKIKIGLATGKTMIPVYKELSNILNKENINTKQIVSFNIDDYVNIKRGRKTDFRYFMFKYLFSKLRNPWKKINFLNGDSENLQKECLNYEKKIKREGVDLQILGIGRNGHIAFNEPGSSFKSKTRIVRLTSKTIEDNLGRAYKSKNVKAITIGISTIMKAKKIILIAFGKKKADAIYNSLAKDPSEKTPASVLQLHKNSIFIFDKSSAFKLLNRISSKCT